MKGQRLAELGRKYVIDPALEAYKGVKRFAVLERVLAAVCVLSPALLPAFDDKPLRDSISAYYNMKNGQVFYFPLTVAAMLFIVNGVVKDRGPYNAILGVMLAGVILFNCNDAKVLHLAFAAAFFGGNAVVILFCSSIQDKLFRASLAGVIVLALLGCFVFKWFSLFWAEWLSFAIIAVHYIIESHGTRRATLQHA